MKSKIIFLIIPIFIVAGAAIYFYWSKRILAPVEQIQMTNTSQSKQLLPPANDTSSQKKCPPAPGATLQCGSFLVRPNMINANIPTKISASTLIFESSPLQKIVLERLDENGKVISIVGNLENIGIGGDLMRGGSPEYGIEFILNEPYPSFVRLRASATFQGIPSSLYTEERYISILPETKAGSEAENILKAVTETLFVAKNVNDLRTYFSERAFSQLTNSVERKGISVLKDFYGPAFKTATLDFKTDRAAEFSIIYLIDGITVASTLEIDKLPEGWKIISF